MPDIAQKELDGGADVNALTGGQLANTPLHWAAACGQTACTELLLKAGADPNIRNKAGKSALDLCVQTRPHEQGPCMPEPEEQIKGKAEVAAILKPLTTAMEPAAAPVEE
jgi:hypothetical protein